MSVFLSWVLGGLTTIFVALCVERLRRPRLRFQPQTPIDRTYENSHATTARYLLIALYNDPPTRVIGNRNAAKQCRAQVTYHREDGTAVFERSLTARWDASPEPVPIKGKIENGPRIYIFDPGRFELVPKMDIFPGERPVNFSIAARFNNEPECYAWSNENYFSDPPWRHPDWKLGPGRYLIRVTVFGSGEKVTGVFRLLNDCPQSSFRLERASEEQQQAVEREISELRTR